MRKVFRGIRRYVWRKLPARARGRVMRLRILMNKWRGRKQADEAAEVFVISFPKCGRTWLRLMIGRAIQLHFDLAGADILELESLADLRADIPRIRISSDDNPLWKRPEELEESKTQYRDKKVILLVRDPRDVVVSAYFQKAKRRRMYEGSLSEFLYEREGGLDSLLKFYNIWAENRDIPRSFLLVRYEDMHADGCKELRRVLDFLGLQVIGDEVVAAAVEYTSFDNMRKMEKGDQFESGRLKPRDVGDEESYKTRRGKVGGYVDYFGRDEIEYLNRKIKGMLSSFYGY